MAVVAVELVSGGSSFASFGDAEGQDQQPCLRGRSQHRSPRRRAETPPPPPLWPTAAPPLPPTAPPPPLAPPPALAPAERHRSDDRMEMSRVSGDYAGSLRCCAGVTVGGERLLLRWLGRFVCVPLALALIACEALTGFLIVVPCIGDQAASPFWKVGTVALGVLILANLLYNYVMVMLVDPGLPSLASAGALPSSSPSLGLQDDGDERRPRLCERCTRLKPARAHHCRVCGRCVLRMDHHCPWVNNCVGLKNYRYFYLLLLYVSVACLYVVLVYPGPLSLDRDFHLYKCTRRLRRFPEWRSAALIAVSLCWLVAAAVFCAISLFWCFHTYLLLTNQTTIEFDDKLISCFWRVLRCRKRKDNPYDLGVTGNFREVFGTDRFVLFRWLLPCFPRPRSDY
eukprot:TRINITY_DN21499_c0_g1_i1.p1 TRINITY_DN21499_c0_g1~~TRINITY_DN21499_c0_g1_i1.p1  ORF type:complete len:411 (+),score=54.26 TRINITY_DN21499_c0_g1_i1:41-1234(+)